MLCYNCKIDNDYCDLIEKYFINNDIQYQFISCGTTHTIYEIHIWAHKMIELDDILERINYEKVLNKIKRKKLFKFL